MLGYEGDWSPRPSSGGSPNNHASFAGVSRSGSGEWRISRCSGVAGALLAALLLREGGAQRVRKDEVEARPPHTEHTDVGERETVTA